MEKGAYKITEFEPKYQEQVVSVIGTILAELKVIPKSDLPINDEDLFKIPEIYSDGGKFWVALDGDKVIGTVAIRKMDLDTAKLNRMFVLEKHRGTGIGQKLLDRALSFAKENGYKSIILNTHLFMKRAHHFYEKNGFVKTATEPDKYHYELKF